MHYTREERFKRHVLSPFQIYNSIFMTLPFDAISSTGTLLPLFNEICQKGFEELDNPTQIVDRFFEKYTDIHDGDEKINLLFRFIQYIERQVVLFDAIEDAAFSIIHNMDGRGTLRSSKEEARDRNKMGELKAYLKEFKVRPVLTAHPTQFYPGTVLGIITDLAIAIEQNDLENIKKLLGQLGKTPFFKKEKPTPYDEAIRLIWYLEHVFYPAAGRIYGYIQENIFEGEPMDNEVVQLGFWPGGDRDGNPYVTTETTLKVAQRLRYTLLKNYHRDLRQLRRRLTFKGVYEKVQELENTVFSNLSDNQASKPISARSLLDSLDEIGNILRTEHQSLFIDLVNDLGNKVRMFGLYFACLDIRQDSRVHASVMSAIHQGHPQLFPDNWQELNPSEKINTLSQLKGDITPESVPDEMAMRILGSIRAMREIQQQNGEQGCNRYIISNNKNELDILSVFAMLRLSGWDEPTVDVLPLFETVDDLEASATVMENLYTNPHYVEHLKRRGNKQIIMLGFSDGTKDGGYLMANWGIYTAKERLTAVARQYGIKLIFFDGRGGPPARGGGKTHQFYASLGPAIEQKEIQLTVQGQTISSNFGTVNSCQYNLEQLLSSGISNAVFDLEEGDFSQQDRATMQELARESYQAYTLFKQRPEFIPYLENMSTLKYYAMTNIGSRPSKRGSATGLVFSDLRAIPFVGSWSQLKQNVPGFYGVGTALQAFKERGEFDRVKALYRNSAFFRALIENSMMSLAKSFFPLTAYMQDDPDYGPFWTLIHDEFKRSKDLILELTGYSELMEDSRAMRASIDVREEIVLPLLTIQQYALREINRLKKLGASSEQLEVWEKMVTRSLFGNINAARNSA
jgi:phosphoenolpyruvate carboxylase